METKTQGRMKCRYCNVALAPLRSLTDGEFCCDEHRQAFEGRGAHRAGGSRDILEPAGDKPSYSTDQTASSDLRAMAQNLNAFDFQSSNPALERSSSAPGPEAGFSASAELNPAVESAQVAVEPEPAGYIPAWSMGPEANTEAEANFSGAQAFTDEMGPGGDELSGKPLGVPSHPSHEVLSSWRWLSAAWYKAPRDLKILLVVLPVLVALAVGPSLPKVKVAVSSPTANNVQQIVVTQWKDLQQTISNRAAIAFSDDFRSGLDAWQSRSNLTRSWSYDASGFVRPGPLAIFKPTTELSDYRFEFLEEIDQKGMGFAFRSSDLDNYYAVKLVVVRPGPLPLVHLVRYAVIHGKETSRVEKPLPFTTRSDTLYRVLVDVRGSDFTIMVQGQVVDFWSDNRLRQGGIGFFCNRGERARLRWVEVSHQYDALGRLCAYLAPYGIDGKNGNLN
jgi:hypothetical protein